MINFACKQFKLEDVIKCGLALTKADCKILKYLLENSTEWFTSESVSTKLKINLTTAQRSLKRLNERDLVIRSQTNLGTGGYIYIYQIKSKKEVKETIMNVIKNWNKSVELELNKWQL